MALQTHKLHCLSVALGLMGSMTSAMGQMTYGYQTENTTGITGLWDSSGTSMLTSSISIVNARYDLSYTTTINLVGTASYSTFQRAYVDAYGNKIWPIKLTVRFNNAGWASYPGATIGLNVGHYIAYTSGATQSIGSAIHYFKSVTGNVHYDSSSPSGISANTGYTSINPRLFTLSQFSVDPSDSTGKTGIATFNVVESAPSTGLGYPWDLTPSPTTVGGTTTTFTGFFGVLWLFPRVGQPGSHNFQQFPQSYYPVDYPVE